MPLFFVDNFVDKVENPDFITKSNKHFTRKKVDKKIRNYYNKNMKIVFFGDGKCLMKSDTIKRMVKAATVTRTTPELDNYRLNYIIGKQCQGEYCLYDSNGTKLLGISKDDPTTVTLAKGIYIIK